MHSDSATGKNGGFFFSLMTALYSGNCSRKADVVRFIDRLRHFGILKPDEIGPLGTIRRRTDGSQAKSITRSVSSQLGLEIRKHLLKARCVEASDPDSFPESVSINHQLSTMEIFCKLNKFFNNLWRLTPLSPMEIGFVTFSETEMASFFMLTRYPHIRAELVKEMKEFSDTSEDS
ncbi:hypothetical protein BGW38_000814 [Lunasporangiospora selenospora]|uniref:Uncharacterized protein n=1 Tax=Lunasporangiospora selenospora TaxID=979761 RepID=A0A9P6KEQ1_9FUNG|nr:hypothetical protein BGW38_000814 [Lunasporangiospora selenospora]